MRFVAVLALALAACGGGSDIDEPEAAPVISFEQQALAEMEAECARYGGIARYEISTSPKSWRVWCKPDADGLGVTARRDYF